MFFRLFLTYLKEKNEIGLLMNLYKIFSRMKIHFACLLMILLFIVEIDSRRSMGTRAGVAKTGAKLGDAVVSILKDIRSKPEPLPKGYKREV